MIYTPEDRTTELALRNSINIAAWRQRAGLPPRPDPQDAADWQRSLAVRFALAAYRRRRRYSFTPPRTAA